MTILSSVGGPIVPATAAPLLSDFGFLASPDLPDRPGPARLLVAIRPAPTFRHFDPESIAFWVSDGERGRRSTLTRDSRMPVEETFSWGEIRIVDRLHVTNEYLTFGGHLAADLVDGDVVAVFESPAPILRRGGHSQGWDQGAEHVGAFFGRLLLAVDFVPCFERQFAQADPLARYSAFLADAAARYRASALLRSDGSDGSDLWVVLQAEERQARVAHPAAWRLGQSLQRQMARGAGRAST
jgi:hypothetical protein